jgi:5-methylcytosine-specific restriction endonuclease McrA
MPKVRDPFYGSPEWLALREQCFRRDGFRCVVLGCRTPTQELTCDHVQARPRGAMGLTSQDTLSNLRTLCGPHDRSVKELANGQRRNGGRLAVRGCDADGRPLDPSHPWNRRQPSAPR